MKLYTKTGDCGQTSLIGGERVSKCDVRVEAYGTVDELSANVALLTDMLRDEKDTEEYVADLVRVGSHLMTVAALLAVGCGGEGKVAEPSEEVVKTLEVALTNSRRVLSRSQNSLSREVIRLFRCATSAVRCAVVPSELHFAPMPSTACRRRH